ncbi:14177_t:CDS:1, partial [Acaulospora morrowiae]
MLKGLYSPQNTSLFTKNARIRGKDALCFEHNLHNSNGNTINQVSYNQQRFFVSWKYNDRRDSDRRNKYRSRSDFDHERYSSRENFEHKSREEEKDISYKIWHAPKKDDYRRTGIHEGTERENDDYVRERSSKSFYGSKSSETEAYKRYQQEDFDEFDKYNREPKKRGVDLHQRGSGFFKGVFEPWKSKETQYERPIYGTRDRTRPNLSGSQGKNIKGSIGDFFNTSVSKKPLDIRDNDTLSNSTKNIEPQELSAAFERETFEQEASYDESRTRNFADRLRLSKIALKRKGDHDENTSEKDRDKELKSESQFNHELNQNERYRRNDDYYLEEENYKERDYNDGFNRNYSFPRRDGYDKRELYEPRDRNFGRRDDHMGGSGRKMFENVRRDLNRAEHERATLGDRDILTWGKYPSKSKELRDRRSNPLTKKNLYKHPWPNLFQRLHGVQDKTIIHFENLRTKKQYRWEQQKVMVQGEAKILDLVNKGFYVKNLIVTAPYKPKTRYEIQPPALDYIEKPPSIMAENYYLMSIDMVRKILGSAAKPEKHELVAEFSFPTIEFPPKAEINRIIVLENVNDAYDLGMLIRSAKAMGWQGVYLINKSGDVYNDFVLRTSDFH